MPHHLPSVDRVRNRRPENVVNYTPFKNHPKHLQLYLVMIKNILLNKNYIILDKQPKSFPIGPFQQ
jgi:hypothetical protein